MNHICIVLTNNSQDILHVGRAFASYAVCCVFESHLASLFSVSMEKEMFRLVVLLPCFDIRV